MRARLPIAMLLVFFLPACRQPETHRFTLLDPSATGVVFNNQITEDEDFNILTYEYLYNGGGVAIGDFNQDGLPDIYLTGNMVPDRLFLNQGKLTFRDVTAEAGVAGRGRWKTGAVVADVNGDGLPDIYLCYSGPGTDEARANQLFLNKGVVNGVPHFEEAAAAWGIDAPGTYSTTASFFDMDNDGDLDLLLVNHADMFYNPYFNTDRLRATRHPKFGNRLYRNDGDHFTDVSEAAGIRGSGLNFGLSVSVSDLNGDGWPDLYVTNDYDERDFLYLNNHDGTFRETLETSAGHLSQFAMGSDIADFNNDGRPDLMELDMLPPGNRRQKLLKGPDNYDRYAMRVSHGFGHQQMRNCLQLNEGVDSAGVPRFAEIGQLAGVSATDWSWAPLFADFDNDGWKDLFISNGILRDMTNLDFVKYTSGYSSQFDAGKQDKGSVWKLVRDMPSTPLTNFLFANDGQLRFGDSTAAWGFDRRAVTNGAAYADLDNDGDLDLVLNTLNGPAAIYRNNTRETDPGLHFLRLRLVGTGKNTAAVGAVVDVRGSKGIQQVEAYPNRGFQSSVDPVLHVGLGRDATPVQVTVHWPGGGETQLDGVKPDTTLTLRQPATRQVAAPAAERRADTIAFRELGPDVTGIRYTDKSPGFVDFKVAPLLPWQTSKTGPALATGDVNGDGLDDLFAGASAGQRAVLYIQQPGGRFSPAADQPWNTDTGFCVSDALFFDADGDGDADLYLVSGGTSYPAGSKYYQDRFFENDGHGRFRYVPDALPPETISGGCVRAGDLAHRGLPDLFVGGRYVPGRFPEAPPSLLLRNLSKPGHIRFAPDPAQTDTVLLRPGMVSDAVWTDLNGDGWDDLVVVGDFMPVTVFENRRGVLADRTKAWGLDSTHGWWNRVTAADLDGDGKPELIVGNFGDNGPFHPTPAEPVTICYADFNHDGLLDPVLCTFNGGKAWPYYSRDEMAGEMPSLQKKFLHYADYADAQLADLFDPGELAQAHTARAEMLQSVVIRGAGRQRPQIENLPVRAQVSPVNGIAWLDSAAAGRPALLLAGNFFPMRAEWGPQDASRGSLWTVDARGRLQPEPLPVRGLCLDGDIRRLVRVRTARGIWFVTAACDGPIRVFQPFLPKQNGNR